MSANLQSCLFSAYLESPNKPVPQPPHRTTAKNPIENRHESLHIIFADRAPLALRFFGRKRDVGRIGCLRCAGLVVSLHPNPEMPLTGYRSIRLNFNLFKRIESMTFSSFRLMQYHQKLDSELRAELARRWPDVFRIQKLKRLKLVVKDRLAKSAARSFGKRLRLQKI